MPGIIVIGCGNTLRGDDGFGWTAVDEIMKTTSVEGVKFLKCRELGPELSEDISVARHALFIDVSVGEVESLVEEEEVLPSVSGFRLDAHSLDPQSLLSLAEALYGRAPDSILLTVKGTSFGFEERISDELLVPMRTLVARALSIIERWQTGNVEVRSLRPASG